METQTIITTEKLGYMIM